MGPRPLRQRYGHTRVALVWTRDRYGHYVAGPYDIHYYSPRGGILASGGSPGWIVKKRGRYMTMLKRLSIAKDYAQADADKSLPTGS